MRAFLILGLLIASPSWATTTKTSMGVSAQVLGPGCVVTLRAKTCERQSSTQATPTPTITQHYNPELGVMQRVFTF